MEYKYSVLRKNLDELGYRESLNIDNVPLVDRLLADLVKTTESLFHYKNVAQAAIEERDQLKLGAEPYKCDNAKLVQECNDLHLAFLQYKEQTEKNIKDSKVRIHVLEIENEELKRNLQKSGEKTSKTSLVRRTIPSKTTKQSSTSVDTAKTDKSKHKCENMSGSFQTSVNSADNKEEYKKLKIQYIQLNEYCETLKEKLNNRDKEINRLTSLLEGGRPLTALNKDCCYKEMTAKLRNLTEENIALTDAKKALEKKLADSISKQHEAMKRALQLADRNKELERELRDIDQMALAVEAECNSAVKKNSSMCSKIQEELDSCTIKNKTLEKEIRDLKRDKNNLESEFEHVKTEKENLHEILENTLDDKKKMTDRINQFTRIEHDLNLEIDRLMQTCTLQKRKISELEYQLTTKSEDDLQDQDMDNDKRRKSSIQKSPRNSNCNKCNRPKKNGKPDKEDNVSVLEKLKGERDYFKSECERLCDQLNDRPTEFETSPGTKQRLKDREEQILKLEKDIQELTRDKHQLLNKLESALESDKWSKDMDCGTLKTVLNRVEKERDLARGDVRRLEEERDSLRKRLKCLTETHVSERDRLQKLMSESTEKLKEYELERHEVMTMQGSRRATINKLEEQIESSKTQLRTTQSELDHIHTLYTQIKTLQEQTDRALADTQGQLTQVEMEYSHSLERIRELEKERADMDKELSLLKNDVCVLKGNLAKIDSQRDNLLIEVDTKTERLATLEHDVMLKENKLLSLETTVTELRKQLSLYTDEAATNEYKLKSTSTEICCLRKELEETKKCQCQAVAENKRLQNDLAKTTFDCRNACGDLERAHREIDDLKTQLQQYVYEVKRAEDLITKKETERAEMLDHFRSLSQEANVLESSNHSLETSALELKNQLTAAKDHIQDLETKVEQATLLNKDYEKEISRLSCQIACLETQVKQHASENNKVETDLDAMRELVCKLDGQKDKLASEIKEKDNYKHHLEREKERLKVEINQLQDTLQEEQSNIGSLEALLSQSRQETVEQRLINQDLHSETLRLKNMVEELQEKLASNTSVPHSFRTVNTVDVRLHSDSSPRSISSIFTNIMQNKKKDIDSPVYEVSCCTDSPRKNVSKNDENDTYRSHTQIDIKCPPKYQNSKTQTDGKNNCSFCNNFSSGELSKNTYSYNYFGGRQKEKISPVKIDSSRKSCCSKTKNFECPKSKRTV